MDTYHLTAPDGFKWTLRVVETANAGPCPGLNLSSLTAFASLSFELCHSYMDDSYVDVQTDVGRFHFDRSDLPKLEALKAEFDRLKEEAA